MKLLVVLLNKDNAEGLRESLRSLVNQTLVICRDFDVLVIDGGSKDESRQVAESFQKNYPCILFKVQKTLGGTGYARLEASLYALKEGYDIVVWGDSENIYERRYLEGLVKLLREGCDVVGGIPVVIDGFWGHAFAWYHAIHIIFPWVGSRHIPGNNRGEKTSIYHRVLYPISKRAEDYGYSLLLLKKGIKLKHCISRESRVRVSLPCRFRDIIKWQKYRSDGVAEVCSSIKVFPYDSLLWSLILFFNIAGLVMLFYNLSIGVALLLLPFLLSIGLFILTYKYIYLPKKRYFLAPYVGILIHSIYSLRSIIKYLILKVRGGRK